MATKYHVNPKMRAYGKARIDITKRAKDEKDWQENWREQLYSYPLKLAEGWKYCFEYKVDDYAAEVGFFIDFLGFPSSAFSPSYARFSSPDEDFFFSISAVQEGEESTPPDTLRIQFNVVDLLGTIAELEDRGIVFEQQPQPIHEGSDILVGCFRTPHGICIDLWSTRDTESSILDDEVDNDDIDEIISNILHQGEENETEYDINSTSSDESETETKSLLVNSSGPGTEQNERKSERTRFPNALERFNQTGSEQQNINRGEKTQKDENSDKIGASSPSQKTDPEEVELTYQELDE